MEAFGTEIDLSPANQGVDGAIRRLTRSLRTILVPITCRTKYSNPNNVKAHYEGTGPEIIEQTKGRLMYLWQEWEQPLP